MGSPVQMRLGAAVSEQHVWVCVFLAVLLLYNPFLMAPGSVGGLNLSHPASYRATVGSSELQQFSPATGTLGVDAADYAVAEVPSVLPAPTAGERFVPHFRLLPTLQFSFASLWFRPPPSL
jgi:hypothetical protein